MLIVREAGGRVSDILEMKMYYTVRIFWPNNITHNEFLSLIENINKF
ncbi:MAG: hypothetical protein IPL98_05435 [Saprospiraceae bacterium]|nr:hypothetical protein [Saprospiraceae bacterium]